MNRIAGAVTAVYTCFAGDPILLVAVLLAVVVAWLLVNAAKALNVLDAVVFVAVIVAGPTMTLGRDLRGRSRQREAIRR